MNSTLNQPRFHVLLTEDRPRSEQDWAHQLARLLEPQGVQAHVARSGREAIRLAEQVQVHAAVLDLGLPAGAEARSSRPGGSAGELWLLELFARLPGRPPVVLLRGPAADRRRAERLLREALRLGAFSVLDKPVGVEQLLAVFQRLLQRQYHGAWPEAAREMEPGRGRPIERLNRWADASAKTRRNIDEDPSVG